jgi:hypothetical protein
VQKVVRGKRILLFKKMLRDISFDDEAVASLMIHGVELTGELPDLPFWQRDVTKDAVLTKQMVLSKWRQSLEQLKARGSEQTWTAADSAVAASTLEEVALGQLEGPYTEAQLDTQLGPEWLAARRFPIEQGDKVRPL